MNLALTSDSHGSLDRLDILLRNLQKAGVRYFLHAGDFLADGIVEILQKYPEIEKHFALGNADIDLELIKEIQKLAHCELKEVIETRIGPLKFAISHVQGVAERDIKDADIYCHGHTHRPKIERQDGKLILNPGALCEDGRYFLIDLNKPDIQTKVFKDVP